MFLKIIFGEQVRRLAVSLDQGDAFDLLIDYLQSNFNCDHFLVRYEDDEGDLVTVSSNEELLEGVRVAVEESRPSLKLHVSREGHAQVLGSPVSTSSQSSGRSFVVLDDLPDLVQSVRSADEANSSEHDYDFFEGLSLPSEGTAQGYCVDSSGSFEHRVPVLDIPKLTDDSSSEGGMELSSDEDDSDVEDLVGMPELEALPASEIEEMMPELTSDCSDKEAEIEMEQRVLEEVAEGIDDVYESEPEEESKQPVEEVKPVVVDKAELFMLYTKFMADEGVQKEIPDAVSVAFVVLEQDPRGLFGALEQVFTACDAIGNHELIQFVRPHLLGACKNVRGWIPKLISLGPETCAAVMPQILNSLPRLFDGGCDLDIDLTSMAKVLGVEAEQIPQNAVHENIICDLCNMNPIVGVRYKCAECRDFDLCGGCEAKEDEDFTNTVHENNHTLLKFRVPFDGRRLPAMGPWRRPDDPQERVKQGLRRLWRQENGQRERPRRPRGSVGCPRADFVRDVTIPDGTEFVGGEKVVKTWAMKNNGSSQWPEGTRLVHAQGPLLHPADQEFPVKCCQVGDTVEVSVEIATPAAPGKYVSYYRLKAPKDGDHKGRQFGQKIWVDFSVKESKPEPQQDQVTTTTPPEVFQDEVKSSVADEPAPSAPAVVADVQVSQEPAGMPEDDPAMQVLIGMGFTNIELNRFILQKKNNDVAAVVDWLLNRMS